MDSIKRDLDYLKNLEYDVIVRKNKDKFILCVHELCILVEDKDLEKAYEKLEFEKEKYFTQIIENDYQDHIVVPERNKAKVISFWNLAPFFVKLVLTTSVAVVLLLHIDDISPTFKHIKRAAKTFKKAINNIEDLTTRVSTGALTTIDNHQAHKKWNVAKKKYMIVSPLEYLASNCMDAHPVEYIFDSELDTFWHSAMSSAYLDIKFKQPTKVEAFSMVSRADISGVQSPKEFTIEGSNDNKVWKPYWQTEKLTWEKGETKNMIIDHSDNVYTYYRFNFIGTTNKNSRLSIAEIKLYSK